VASVNLACVRSRGRYSQVTVGRDSRPRDRAATRSPSRDRAARPRDETSLKRGSETAQALAGGRRHVQEGVHSSRRLRDSGTRVSLKIPWRVGTLCRATVWRSASAQATVRRPASYPFSLLYLRRATNKSSCGLVTSPKSIDSIVSPSDRMCVTDPAASRVRSGAALDEQSVVASASTIHRVRPRDSFFGFRATLSVTSHGNRNHPARTEVRHSRASGQCPRLSNDEDGPAFGAFEFRHSSWRHLFVS
jgi:hypothetical protein